MGLGGYFLFRYFRKKHLFELLNLVLFLIKIPKEDSVGPSTGKEKDFKTEINRFEQLISNLSSSKKPFIFEVAVPHIGEEIHFYLAVPHLVSEVATKQVQGIWPGAIVEPALPTFFAPSAKSENNSVTSGSTWKAEEMANNS